MRNMRWCLPLAMLVLVILGTGLVATGANAADQMAATGAQCASCHAAHVDAWSPAKHAAVSCESCHEGAVAHAANPAQRPKVHFANELCSSCHQQEYSSWLEDHPGPTFYGGSVEPVERWPKTLNFPYWNTIIDGHPFVIETFEDRAMRWNQIDAQNTRRPMSEACLTCHGTKVAYYMGLNAPKARTIESTQIITSGNFLAYQVPAVAFIEIPAGTTVSTYVDTLDAAQPYQVKSEVRLPDGRVYRSYTDATLPVATATGDSADPAMRTEARNYIWAGLEALAFDGLDPSANQESRMSGELCTMCHDPHSARLRVIQKPLIDAISKRGINPYSASKSQIKDFNLASRQDQIIAVCGQCHVEYVGGYSAVDNVDRFYFPWAKAGDTEIAYNTLFRNRQDWVHGTGVHPSQSADPGERAYAPYGELYPINAPLVKSQHPEAEVFWNSQMYNAGATCIDCHSITSGCKCGGGMGGGMGGASSFTSHYFASPIKLYTEKGYVPCSKCHMMMSGSQMEQKIKGKQDVFFALQEKAQVALVNSLKYINSLPPGAQRDAAVANHQGAHLRWEYYTQAENSMGFHNWDEAAQAVTAARQLADALVPLPLPPVQLRVASATASSITLSWLDQATDETSFAVDRQDAASGSWIQVATIASTTPASTGTVLWTNSGLVPQRTYVYRVSAANAAGTSAHSLPVAGSTAALALPQAPSNLSATLGRSRQVVLAWQDNASNEQGFRIERRQASGAFVEIARVAANTRNYSDAATQSFTTYTYRVLAYNAGGDSPPSNEATVTTRRRTMAADD